MLLKKELATGSENRLCLQIDDGADNFTDTAKTTGPGPQKTAVAEPSFLYLS